MASPLKPPLNLIFYGICVMASIVISEASPMIDVSPSEINLGLSETLEVNCSYDAAGDSNIAAIMSLILSRSNDSGQSFTELAAINAFSPHTVNHLTTEVFSAEGFADQMGESYLHVTWKHPTGLQGGDYKCSAQGLDPIGHAVLLADSAHVSVNALSMQSVLDTMNEMKQQITDMQTYIQNLESKITSLERQRDIRISEHFLPPFSFNHRYYISKGPGYDVHSATSTCRRNGGYLAEINDNEEYHALQSFLKTTTGIRFVVIGGTEEGHIGNWTLLSTDQSLPVLDWAPGEGGTNVDDGFNCLALITPTWQMADVLCQYSGSDTRFMCELP